MKSYYVYIMASDSGTLYVGLTNNIERRTFEHKTRSLPGFTDKYDINRLLYIETFSNPDSAIAREKQLKTWRREKKIALIDSTNPAWPDLAENWYK